MVTAKVVGHWVTFDVERLDPDDLAFIVVRHRGSSSDRTRWAGTASAHDLTVSHSALVRADRAKRISLRAR